MRRELQPKPELMKFDLLSYRFGALATLYPEAAKRLTLPAKSNLLAAFREQQREIQRSDRLVTARRLIHEVARKRLGDSVKFVPGNNQPPSEESAPRSVRGLSPPFGQRRPLPSSHLAAVFPRDHLTFQLSHAQLALRIRASVTACALEDPRGFPKLWWTFEAIPANPEKGDKLTLLQARSLLRFARELENDLLGHLNAAYFESLAKVTNSEDLEGKLLDRLHIRCVDSADEGIAALIDALRFRVQSADELQHSEGQSLKVAKRALTTFNSFITHTNDDLAIDPGSAEPETRLSGVEGVTARKVDRAKGDVAIVGIVQAPSEPTPYDHLSSVQKLRSGELTEERLRRLSPARRLSAELANDAAQQLDDLRHAKLMPALHAAP